MAEQEDLDLDDKDLALQTFFANSKAGKKKFNGWNDQGIVYCSNKWYDEIKSNQEVNDEYLKAVEMVALARIKIWKEEDLEEEVLEAEQKSKPGSAKRMISRRKILMRTILRTGRSFSGSI